jgi:hypothetical protein
MTSSFIPYSFYDKIQWGDILLFFDLQCFREIYQHVALEDHGGDWGKH